MKKIAIFGSAFNPPHLGHVCLLKEAQKHFNFDTIKVIPTGQDPFTKHTAGPPGRLELVKKVFKDLPFVEVEDWEIKQSGPSWTIDTLKFIIKKEPARFFIIIGLDQWALFDRWKHFKSLLKKAHIVVVNRAGYEWSSSTPPFIKELLYQSEERFQCHPYQLKKNHRIYGQDIYYLSIKLPDISSSQVNQLFKKGESIEHLVPAEVPHWLRQQVSQNLPPPIEEALEVFLDKQGRDIKVFDLRQENRWPFDWTVVVSGLNTRHTKAMAEALKKQIRKKLGLRAINMEGLESGEWLVLDYGDIVFHVFYAYTREYYRLEDIWPHPIIKVSSGESVANGGTS